MASIPSELSERVYDFITEADEGRICEAIPDSACQQAPQNFVLNALNGSVTKLAERLASPGLVLPWLLSALGAPAALAGLFFRDPIGHLGLDHTGAGRSRSLPSSAGSP